MVQRSSRLSWTPPAGGAVVTIAAYGDTTIGVNRHRKARDVFWWQGFVSHIFESRNLLQWCTTDLTVIIVSVHSRLYRLQKHGRLCQLGKGQKCRLPIHCRAHTPFTQIPIPWTNLESPKFKIRILTIILKAQIHSSYAPDSQMKWKDIQGTFTGFCNI